LEAFLLSHIKAPAQGGKAGGGKPPKETLTNIKSDHKSPIDFFDRG
jgi:hypothetical protein